MVINSKKSQKFKVILYQQIYLNTVSIDLA